MIPDLKAENIEHWFDAVVLQSILLSIFLVKFDLVVRLALKMSWLEA